VPSPWPASIDLGPLQDHFAHTVRDRLAEGWWVRNPDVIRKIMNNFGRLPMFWDSHSGQCGEFADLGEEWVKDYVTANHPGSKIDQVVYQYPTGHYDGTGGGVAELVDSVMPNHAATRIILPDGQRVIADFWDYLGPSQGEPPRLVPEGEWAEKWGRHIYGNLRRSADEDLFTQFVDRFGERDGLAHLRTMMHTKGRGETFELLLRSWQRNPW
jgi:hypothetical protein